MLSALTAFFGGDLLARMPAGHGTDSGGLDLAVNQRLDTIGAVVREFSRVVTAIAEGDLAQAMPLEVNGQPLRGPLLQLAKRINRMRAQLARLASEVGRITREVGIEGRLGGQAALPDSSGAWRDLTDNVNSLAARLTSQVWVISTVTAAMAKGDLGTDLEIDASGELAMLRDNINALIHSLRETTRRNAEQDWLKTNVARFTRKLQGQRSVAAVAGMLMSELAPLISMQHGLFYTMDTAQLEQPVLRLSASYAAALDVKSEWRLGEGLIGQCAQDRLPLLVTDVPAAYLTIRTGSAPRRRPAC